MSKTQLQTNNTRLASLIQELQGKAAGGGASVETCTVTVNIGTELGDTDGIMERMIFQTQENGETVTRDITSVQSGIFENVVKNSLFCTQHPDYLNRTIEGATLIFEHGYIEAYTINSDATLQFYTCFVKGTQIMLANGITKAVENITYNDKLLVWDFDNGCYASAHPLWIKKAQTASSYYLCRFDNGTELKLVGSNGRCHRVFSLDRNMFESATECVGERVITRNGEAKLVSCERIEETVEFYNIITHMRMNLFAEGVLASCRLNNLYPIENMRFVKENREEKNRADFPNIDDNMFNGLRLAEQTMSAEEINEYVSRLYALMQT